MPPLKDQRTGVYCWRNLVNGKVYVGSSSRSLVGRQRVHLSSLRGGYHQNPHLQAAWNKYGEGSFIFEVLEYTSSTTCLVREQWWIDYFDSAKDGYNSSPTAGSSIGCIQSPEANQKRSSTMRGRTLSIEHRQRVSAARTGMKFSAQHRANISAAKKGATSPTKGVPSNRKGIPLSSEHRARISASSLGKKASLEHRAKQCGYRVNGRGRQKLTKEDVVKIRELLATNVRVIRIARLFNVSSPTISNIHAGRTWTCV